MKSAVSKVFISYAREDRQAAQKLYANLRQRGFNPWLDEEDMLPGQQWKPAITEAIRSASHFIALLSTQAVEKRGFVQTELHHALELLNEFPETAIYVIPVRLDDCQPSHVRLRDLHWVDLFPEYEKGLERIVAALSEPGADTYDKLDNSGTDQDLSRSDLPAIPEENDHDAPHRWHRIRIKIAGLEVEITGKFAIVVVAGLVVAIVGAILAVPDFRNTVFNWIGANPIIERKDEPPDACVGLTKEDCELYCQRYPSEC